MCMSNESLAEDGASGMPLEDITTSTHGDVVVHRICPSQGPGGIMVLGEGVIIVTPDINRAKYVPQLWKVQVEEVRTDDPGSAAYALWGTLYDLKRLSCTDDTVQVRMLVEVTDTHSGASVKRADNLKLVPPAIWCL